MERDLYNSYLYVDLEGAAANYRSLRARFAPDTQVIPVLKGDAFGLGLLPVARRLLREGEPPYLGVAHAAEGAALRDAKIQCPILVLAGILPTQCKAVVQYDLTPGVGRLGIVPLLAKEAERQEKTVCIHLTIDTGLGRLGVRPGEELSALLDEIKAAGSAVRVTGTYSHFAKAETEQSPMVTAQYEQYLAVLDQIADAGMNPGMRHLSNSAASEWFPQADFDAVRLGRRLFFDSPTTPNGSVHEIASWRTAVTNLRCVKAGERFGYGEGIRLDHDAQLALIGVGYGDGLLRTYADAHAPILIRGQRAPLLGLCMDQAFVDATGISCEVGDEATLFGWDKEGNFLSAQETAARIDDEGCGLTSVLTPRVKRIYSQEKGV